MHVLLIPIGSHGDVHPFVGLGLALRDRGHRVTLITSTLFEPLARRFGFDFEELVLNRPVEEVINNPDLWHPTRGFELVVEVSMLGTMRTLFEQIRRHFVPGETVV